MSDFDRNAVEAALRIKGCNNAGVSELRQIKKKSYPHF